MQDSDDDEDWDKGFAGNALKDNHQESGATSGQKGFDDDASADEKAQMAELGNAGMSDDEGPMTDE